MNDQPTRQKGFIVFEGIDGAGTTTQTQYLAARLGAAGQRVWLTSEPTERPVGLIARRVLAGDLAVAPEAVAHIFAADRCDHLYSPGGIVERLAGGEIVVCDRYKYSSLAYQTIEIGGNLVESLNAGFDDPELVVFLDLPVHVGEQRLATRTRRDIYERLEFQEKVRERYLRVLKSASSAVRVVTLDGTLAPDILAEKIWEAVGETSIL
ncbi:MAG: dTMP kinase [Spirochaetota bacterium]